MERKLQGKDRIVITDCRFPNELKTIKNLGGIVIWIRRGDLPPWYDIAIKANNGDINAKEQLIAQNVHASETSWVGNEFDYIITNDKTIDDIKDGINEIINKL